MKQGADEFEPVTRVFLSIDVHGSLRLKNSRNKRTLLNTYQKRREVLASLSTRASISIAGERFKIDQVADPLKDSPEAIREILHDYSTVNSFWASILEQRFKEFHSAFAQELQKRENKKIEVHNIDYHLWKRSGDELIYCCKVLDRQQLYDVVVAFLISLMRLDKTGKEKELPGTWGDDGISVRFKGAGWVADFPVRNREVQFPGPTLYRKKAEGTDPQFVEVDYPKKDYLGPDVDAGFRISKFTHPGIMVASLELAELLGNEPLAAEKPPLRGAIVAWKELHGVWNDKLYPIIWLTLPHEIINQRAGQLQYSVFSPREEHSDPLVIEWKTASNADPPQPPKVTKLAHILGDTRRGLPRSLGLVEPYLLGDKDPLPDEHQRILHILRALSRGPIGPQAPPEVRSAPPKETPSQKPQDVNANLDRVEREAKAEASHTDETPDP